MKFSIMSYTFDVGGWFKENKTEGLKAICRLTQELGMAGIDWVTVHDMDSAEVRHAMDDHGLKTVCYTHTVAGLNADTSAARRAAVDSVRTVVDTAVTLGTDTLMLVASGRADVPRHISRRNYIRGLQESIAVVHQAVLTATIESFPGVDSPFVVSSDVLEAIRDVPGLKLTYDNGNVYQGNEDPAEFFERCAPYVVHAHFKDWDCVAREDDGREGLDGRYYRPALIGEGCVDHKRCLAGMRRAGYAGCINIEYEGKRYTPDEATRRAVQYLRGLMREIEN